MSDAARTEILRRIRDALGGEASEAGDAAAGGSPAGVPRDYRRTDDRDSETLVALFCERVRDYAADARRVPADGIGEAVAAACARMGIARIAVAPGVPAGWHSGAAVTAVAGDDLDAAALDELGAVLTGCAVAIAETGTVVLDGRPASGRRELSLVPDRHICVVTAGQVVGQVPEAIAHLHDAVVRERVPVTFVSGASATSDIELQRVEGVHGPRTLLVLVAG